MVAANQQDRRREELEHENRRLHAKWHDAETNHDQIHRLQLSEIDSLSSRLAAASVHYSGRF
jgi:hypothetical protein